MFSTMTRTEKFCVVVMVILMNLIVVLAKKTSEDATSAVRFMKSSQVEPITEDIESEGVFSDEKRSPNRISRPTRYPRPTRPLLGGSRLTLRPRKLEEDSQKVIKSRLENYLYGRSLIKENSNELKPAIPEKIIPSEYPSDVSSLRPAIIDTDGLESTAEQVESEAELITNSKNLPNVIKTPSRPPRGSRPRRSIEQSQLNDTTSGSPVYMETSTQYDIRMSFLEPVVNSEDKENDSKIFVNPNNNAVNFVRPSPIKPTTEQVEFEAGVPPGWTNPPSQPTRPTRPTRRTRPTRPTRITRSPYRPSRLKLKPDLLEEPQLNDTLLAKPAVIENFTNVTSITTELNNSSMYPPGVSPPEPVITDPDRGVVEWILGLVGIKPNPDNQEPQSSTAPERGCSNCVCGLTYKHNRIVGGVETQVNEYPWMVILMYTNRFYCGASVINNKYLLTAGHCVNGFAKERLSAVFLDHDRSTNFETKTFSRKITKILRHKSYGSGGSYNNDIALLKIDEELSFNGLLKPVCLPTVGKSFTGYKGIVTGWGATQAHGSVSNKLREVEVPIMSNEECRRTGYGQRITDNMLCAGYPQGQKDSCQGDSGGPLHVLNGTNHIVAGIVSWGEGCAEPNYPGVYTRVNRYISWIYSNTKDACYCS